MVKAPQRPRVRIEPGRKLVVCADGPKAGRWYYLDDWKVSRDIAQRMEGVQARDTTLDYAPTQELRDHPTADTVGTVLRYRPGWDHPSMTKGTTT